MILFYVNKTNCIIFCEITSELSIIITMFYRAPIMLMTRHHEFKISFCFSPSLFMNAYGLDLMTHACIRAKDNKDKRWSGVLNFYSLCKNWLNIARVNEKKDKWINHFCICSSDEFLPHRNILTFTYGMHLAKQLKLGVFHPRKNHLFKFKRLK